MKSVVHIRLLFIFFLSLLEDFTALLVHFGLQSVGFSLDVLFFYLNLFSLVFNCLYELPLVGVELVEGSPLAALSGFIGFRLESAVFQCFLLFYISHHLLFQLFLFQILLNSFRKLVDVEFLLEKCVMNFFLGEQNVRTLFFVYLGD